MTEFTEEEIQQAETDIKNLIDDVYKKIRLAEEIASKFKLDFKIKIADTEEVYYGEDKVYEEHEWESSSSSC